MIALVLVLGYSFIKRRDLADGPKAVPAVLPDKVPGKAPEKLPEKAPERAPEKAPEKLPAPVPPKLSPPTQPTAKQLTPEQQREADLKAAKACEQAKDWACVTRMTERVLAADSGNKEAKALKERAMRVQLGLD